MQSDNAVTRNSSFTDILIMVLVLGTLWGFSEVVLSDAIKILGIPYRAGILTGIGMGIMGIALGYGRKVLPLIAIALVTMAAKQLVVPVLQCSVLCKANSCAAVLLQGGALCGAAAIAGQKLHNLKSARLVTPVSAALLAAGAFYFIGMRLAPCPYLLSFNHPGGLLSFFGAEGLSWAVFSGILFPAGYKLGSVLKNTVPAIKTTRPAAYYITAASVLACCYTAITISIMKSGI
ncbi:MAG TPA: hypothetical protein ENN05_10420 [Deltaproteobacteria bacterium]|nr:hypothetical protein [Deltaproteobacteria bacterium]